MLRMSPDSALSLRDARISPQLALAASRLRTAYVPPAARLRRAGEQTHVFLWLARLVVWRSLVQAEPPPEQPAQLVAALRERLGALFDDKPEVLFPVLCQWPPQSVGPWPALSAAHDALEGIELEPPQADLLGPLYELAVRPSRARGVGQYMTPHSVVRLALSRVCRGVQRGVVWDPACGTGAFLVPVALRLRRACAGGPEEQARFVLSRLRGAEVSPVAHALAQANLLLCLADLLPHVSGKLPRPRVELMDSLALLRGEGHGQAAVVVGNPPYLGERRHKALFDDAVDRHPALRQFRWARMDLFYWFIILGLDLLRPGGRLAFITTSYWLTADGAEELRAHIAHRAVVREIVDFGTQRVFPSATGQHSMVFVLEKRAEPAEPAQEQVLLAQLKHPGPLAERCEQLAHALELMERGGEEFENAQLRVAWVPFAAQAPAGPWHFSPSRRTAEALDLLRQHAAPLEQFLEVHQGLVSGADRVVRPHLPLLAPNAEEGEGIFVLDENQLARAGIPRDCPVVQPFYKNSDIEAHQVLPRSPRLYVLYLDGTRDIAEFPQVRAHLERFRPILERRRECREGRIPWWRLHWPRERSIFLGEKIVCPHRAEHNRFAYHRGPFFASADVYFLVAPWRTTAELLFFAGLLNSTVLDLWCRERGKRKGHLREYYSTPLRNIPLVAPPAILASAQHPIIWAADAALQDVEYVLERTRWARARGDYAATALVLVQAVRKLIALRRKNARSPQEMLSDVLHEQRLEELIDELTMDLYGLTGSRAWVREWIAEQSAP